MTSLRLGIDLDGVVADFVAGWISRYNQEFEADLTPASVQTWDGLHTLTHFRDKDEFWKWASDHGGGSVFRHLETYEGATDALHELAMQGHEIVILTLKPDWAVHDTFAWIADPGPCVAPPSMNLSCDTETSAERFHDYGQVAFVIATGAGVLVIAALLGARSLVSRLLGNLLSEPIADLPT